MGILIDGDILLNPFSWIAVIIVISIIIFLVVIITKKFQKKNKISSGLSSNQSFA